MSKPLPKRDEIPVEDTWDLESIYPTVDAWEAALAWLQAQVPDLQAFKGRLSEGPQTLLDYFELTEKVMLEAGKVMQWAMLGYSVDTTNTTAAARADRSRGVMAALGAATAFAQPELLALGPDTLQQWMAESEALRLYAHYFDRLEQRRAHVRSPEVEAIFGQLSDVFRTATQTHSILTDADLVFEPVPAPDPADDPLDVAQSTIRRLLTDGDRDVRRAAWTHYADAYLAYRNTMANVIAAGVKQNVFLARNRNYDSALHAAVAPSYLPTDVFHNTIDTFKKNIPTWHRYWRARRLALGVDELHPYDFFAPLARDIDPVPFDRSLGWIANGLAPLGDEYVEVMTRGVMEQRWVDKYPNKGKRLGAFSFGVKDSHPFVFMSYSEDLQGMSTLAHELGHSLHSYYSRQQPLIYSRYSLFEAEVASNFNQAMTRAWLLDNFQEPEFQIAVIEEAMGNFYRYFFVMPTLARFELEIHQRVERGEALTADVLINLMADLFAEGYGDEVVMDRERVGITWAQFPTHLYSNFYVYQYTTGISGAHALASRILSGAANGVDYYLAFLRAGGSNYPLANLALAGVDMRSPEPVEQTFAVLSDYVDRLENLITQRNPTPI